MQSHTAEGDEIVADLDFPCEIRPVVRSHHARWEGMGYPEGLAGEDISFTAGILRVADVYDALTTTRSYRAAMSAEEALEFMAKDTGRILDPQLFPLFQSVARSTAPTPDVRFPIFGTESAT